MLLRWVYAIPVGHPGQWPDDWKRTRYKVEFEANSLREFEYNGFAAIVDLLTKARFIDRPEEDPQAGPDLMLDVWVPSERPPSGPMRKRWGLGSWGEAISISAGHVRNHIPSADQLWSAVLGVLADPDRATAFFKDNE